VEEGGVTMGRHRDRESGMGLLPRMEARVGVRGTSYRYRPVGGKPIPLGNDRLAAIRKVLDLLGRAPHAGSLRYVWEKYQLSPRYKRLAEATRADYEQCWLQIDEVLGDGPIGSIDAPMVAKYIIEERADAPTRANHEKALLSNLFAHGILLGLCKDNPAKSVRPNEEEPRTEAPDAEVLARFLSWVDQQTPQRRIVGLAARFASLAGCRKVEFLDLVWPQIDLEEGIVRIKRAKQRGRKRDQVIDEIAISPALRTCIDDLAKVRSNTDMLLVFPNRDGNAYTARAFKTLWQRIVTQAIAEQVITKEARFTFHDLRAFYATRHKAVTGTLPDLHKNPETTARVYDRNRVVKRSSL
jgi:integrase